MLRGVLHNNKDFLANIAMTYERTRELQLDAPVPPELHVLLAACRDFGIAIVARSLLLEGTRAAKAELMPPAVASFVDGLGRQQLPDGQFAGQQLPEVTELLASFGQITGSHADAALAEAVSAKCKVADEPGLWASLPYALALAFMLPEWDHALWGPRLSEDALGGNAHCVVHALHALLTLAEPHMPRGHSDAPGGWAAHRRFLEVASLVLLHKRRALRKDNLNARDVAHRERSLASIVLLLEQLVQLAEPLGYGDLQPVLPYSLVLASYATISLPVDAVTGHVQLMDVSDAPGAESQKEEKGPTFFPGREEVGGVKPRNRRSFGW